MRYFLYSLLFVSFCFSYSLDDLKKDLTGILPKKLLNSIFVETKKEPEVTLPDIPKIQQSSTDNSVYSLTAIQKKRSKFDNLSSRQKAKYRYLFLQELYETTLIRKATKDDLSIYLSRLRQGASREGIYRSLISGEEYLNLEKNPSLASKELIQFTNSFSRKFLNMKFSSLILKNSNKHTIKKNLIERSLMLLRMFYQKPQDLYAWYAVFSENMAKRFEWKNKFRNNNSLKAHYIWAQNASLDHIISEVIIKLNKVCNAL